MPQYIITPLLSILGALIVAGIVAWIRKPRLAYLVPRLFNKSNTSEHVQLAEITVLNRGFGNEEDVVLTLNPKFKYEITGSTSRDYVFEDNKLTIPRIGSNKEITVVLTVEAIALTGQLFSQADIESCLSKATTGIGAASLAEVPSSGQSKIAGVVTFIFIPILAFTVFWGLEKLFNPKDLEANASAAEASAKSAEIDAASAADAASQALAEAREAIANKTKVYKGWKVPSLYYNSGGKVFRDFERGAITITVGDIKRSSTNDLVAVPVLIKNLTDSPIRYSFTMTTAASESDERTPSYDRRLNDIFVAPNSVSAKEIKVVLPRNAVDPVQRMIWADVFIKDADGDTLSISQIIEGP